LKFTVWVIDMFSDNQSGMVVTNFTTDIVHSHSPNNNTDQNDVSVPLFEVYNHHFALYLGTREEMDAYYSAVHTRGLDGIGGIPCWRDAHPLQHCDYMGPGHAQICQQALRDVYPEVFSGASSPSLYGGATGGEMRHNPHDFPEPYGIVTYRPHSYTSTAISSTYSPLIECPCTSDRHFNFSNGTIDGCMPSPPFSCNALMNATKNPSCQLETYKSGYRCYIDPKNKLSPATVSVRGKFTFTFHSTKENTKPLFPMGCCDVTANYDDQLLPRTQGNAEYTVPSCTDPECPLHVFSNVQPINPGPVLYDGDVELVHAVAHGHTGVVALELYDELTGDLLCRADIASGKLQYGTSDLPGDEMGWLVGIEPCVWGGASTPPRFPKDHPLRTVVYYNRTVKERSGVMGLWFLQAAKVD
ncbi:hypothetical protein AURANDRAFT_67282, partial [Aureococcus anophagefferens]